MFIQRMLPENTRHVAGGSGPDIDHSHFGIRIRNLQTDICVNEKFHTDVVVVAYFLTSVMP